MDMQPTSSVRVCVTVNGANTWLCVGEVKALEIEQHEYRLHMHPLSFCTSEMYTRAKQRMNPGLSYGQTLQIMTSKPGTTERQCINYVKHGCAVDSSAGDRLLACLQEHVRTQTDAQPKQQAAPQQTPDAGAAGTQSESKQRKYAFPPFYEDESEDVAAVYAGLLRRLATLGGRLLFCSYVGSRRYNLHLPDRYTVLTPWVVTCRPRLIVSCLQARIAAHISFMGPLSVHSDADFYVVFAAPTEQGPLPLLCNIMSVGENLSA